MRIMNQDISDGATASELPLGFVEESSIAKFIRFNKTKISKLSKEIKVSGIFNNFWVINIVFLNLIYSLLIWLILNKYYERLPKRIGINLDNYSKVDSIIPKNYLFYILGFHLIIPIFTLWFGFKSQNKLNHLFIITFFTYLVLGVFEIIALKNLIFYFM